MANTDQRIVRFRGDTIPDSITVAQVDGSVPVLTGFQFIMTLNRRKNPATVADQVWQIVGVITDVSAGTVEFAFNPAQADQPVGTYYMDIQMVDGVGRIETILKMPYEYVQDLTK
jgi:hypothetical protein